MSLRQSLINIYANNYISTTDLPFSIYIFGCQGSGDSTHHSSQNAWHSMQVMNATSVLNLQFWLQNRLKEHKRAANEILRFGVGVYKCVSEKCATNCEVFVSQDWNSSSKESHDHRAKCSQHHLSSCSNSNTTSQCSILNVHLRKTEAYVRVCNLAVCNVISKNDHKGMHTMSNLPSGLTRAEKANVANVQAARE